MRSSEAQATRLVVRALSASKLGRLDIPWLKKGRRLCAVRRLSTVQEAGVPSSPIPRSRRSPPPRECQIPAAASFESKRTCQCSALLLSRESRSRAPAGLAASSGRADWALRHLLSDLPCYAPFLDEPIVGVLLNHNLEIGHRVLRGNHKALGLRAGFLPLLRREPEPGAAVKRRALAAKTGGREAIPRSTAG